MSQLVLTLHEKVYISSQHPASHFAILNTVFDIMKADLIFIDIYELKKLSEKDISKLTKYNKKIYIDSTYELFEESILRKLLNSVPINSIKNLFYFYIPRSLEHNSLKKHFKKNGMNFFPRQYFIDNLEKYKPVNGKELEKKVFLCMNGKPNAARSLLVSLLSKNNLLNYGHVSFFSNEYVDKNFSLAKKEDGNFRFSKDTLSIIDKEISLLKLPLAIDCNVFTFKISHETNFNAEPYHAVDFVIVSETYGSAIDEEFFVTEKTAKCIILNKKFIPVASQNFLKNLKDYCKNNLNKDISHLTDWCDTSYDDISNLEDRIKKIIEIVKSQCYEYLKEEE